MKKSPRERFRRPPLQRVMRIHDAIQNGRYPNCVAMAVELEVSHKTAKRDVEFMRDRVNLPIDFDPHRKRYALTVAAPRGTGIGAVVVGDVHAAAAVVPPYPAGLGGQSGDEQHGGKGEFSQYLHSLDFFA